MPESWATGVPIVSIRVGMAADYIRDGENGFLTEPEDYKALAEKAIRVIEDSSLREKFIRNGFNDVRQLDWSVIADQYYNKLYKQYLR